MRISDWSSDVCASDLVRIWAGGKYAHRNLDAREISDFFRWRIMGLFSIAAPPAVDVSKGGGVAAIRYCRIVIPPLPSPVRSAERRVGKECVSTCRSRWSPDTIKNTNNA